MRRLTQSPLIFTLVLLIVVPVVVTKIYKRADRKSFTANAILEFAPTEFQPVRFGNEAELLAVDMTLYEGKYKSADSVQVSLSINGKGLAPQTAGKSNVNTLDNKYTFYSQKRIEETLRISRMPVLVR